MKTSSFVEKLKSVFAGIAGTALGAGTAGSYYLSEALIGINPTEEEKMIPMFSVLGTATLTTLLTGLALLSEENNLSKPGKLYLYGIVLGLLGALASGTVLRNNGYNLSFEQSGDRTLLVNTADSLTNEVSHR